jgi:hypothetical protein
MCLAEIDPTDRRLGEARNHCWGRGVGQCDELSDWFARRLAVTRIGVAGERRQNRKTHNDCRNVPHAQLSIVNERLTSKMPMGAS